MTYGSWNHQYVYECYFQNNSAYTEVQVYLLNQMPKERRRRQQLAHTSVHNFKPEHFR